MKGLKSLNSQLVGGYSIRRARNEAGQKVFEVLQGEYIKEVFSSREEARRYLAINDILPVNYNKRARQAGQGIGSFNIPLPSSHVSKGGHNIRVCHY